MRDREPPLLPRRVFAAVIALQVLVVALTQVGPLGRRAWAVRERTALVRSARLSYGSAFAEYIEFLRRVIPEDALVVIPPPGVDPPFGEMPFVQYYLFPRRLTNCPADVAWQECVVRFLGEDTYLVATRSFPPPEGLAEAKVLVALDENRGVYIPRHSGAE
jgi:hypothetical protein